MGIFASIRDKIFGGATAEAAPATPPEATPGPAPAIPPPPAPAKPPPVSPVPAAAAAASATPMPIVDVEAILTDLAAKAGQPLDWRRSIVDLMKLLDLDSSLSARKELAKELSYGGDTSDSATMNEWLIKRVM